MSVKGGMGFDMRGRKFGCAVWRGENLGWNDKGMVGGGRETKEEEEEERAGSAK